mmetsp:Transcript_11152/g.68695  ORF Transcript_11152/g.68695 Transcript_11152/m.68695 type:complete len:264 (-) Transcript_11152:3500-4291(-)
MVFLHVACGFFSRFHVRFTAHHLRTVLHGCSYFASRRTMWDHHLCFQSHHRSSPSNRRSVVSAAVGHHHGWNVRSIPFECASRDSPVAIRNCRGMLVRATCCCTAFFVTQDGMKCTTCFERSPTLKVLRFEVETQAVAVAGQIGIRAPNARRAEHVAVDATGCCLDVLQRHRHRQETRTWTAAAHTDVGLDSGARRCGRSRAQNRHADAATWSALCAAGHRAGESGLQLRLVCSHRPWFAGRRARRHRGIGCSWIRRPNVQKV